MHSSEIFSVENGEVSRLLIESAGENSLLNERSKSLNAGCKLETSIRFTLERKRYRLKEFTPFNALEITQIQQAFVKTLLIKAATFNLSYSYGSRQKRSRQEFLCYLILTLFFYCFSVLFPLAETCKFYAPEHKIR